jgi:DNA gyrase subunit B
MKDYRAEHIQVLEGIEAVRKRPGMYIGGTGLDGLHHLIWEVVANSVDESLAGYCKNINVIIESDNRVSVVDDGRGIPIDIHPKTKKSALETVLTMLHAGGKFDQKIYKSAGGLHGVGVSVVNALSKYLKAIVKRDGYVWTQEYKQGRAVTELKKGKPTKENGTTIIFEPDPQIFPEIKWEIKKILDYLRHQAYLTPGLRINFEDKRNNFRYSFYFEKGLQAFFDHLIESKKPVTHDYIYIQAKGENFEIESAFTYLESSEVSEYFFTNNILNPEGGTHQLGFRSALVKTFNKVGTELGLIKESNGLTINAEDTRGGLVVILSLKIPEPQFEGQTKAKLGNPEAKSIVEEVISQKLEEYLHKNPNNAKAIINRVLLNTQARKAAKAAREAIFKKRIQTGLTLSGKLADCSSRDPAKRELFVVEGDSAGGSAKQGRDRIFQAVLPLRGKILNVEKASFEKILKSQEIKNLILALGTGFGKDFNLEGLRYSKIIIAADADSVTGDTPILIFDKQKQEFFLTEVGEFIENCLEPNRYKVMICNLKTKKRELKEIYQTIKHPLRTPIYEIKTYCGYSVKITSCHSIYVYRDGKILVKKGNEVKNGDHLIFPKSFPRQDKEYFIDLKDVLLNSNFKNISIKVSSEDIKRIPQMAWCDLDIVFWTQLQKQRELTGISRKRLGELIGIYPGIIQQWEQKIDNVMPRFYQFQKYLNQIKIAPNNLQYDVYIPLEEWPKEISLPENAKFYLKNHTHQIKTKFKLDEDLAYLIGIYLGDGCACPEKGNPNRFLISLNKEKSEKYIQRLSKIIKEKFNVKPIIDYQEPNNIQLYFHSFSFKLLLMKLGLFGKKCNQKFIPDIFFNTKKEIQEALLEGLLHSDGFIIVWQNKKSKKTKAIYGWRLSSQKLVQGMLTIFRQLGIFPAYNVRQGKDHLRNDGKVIRSNFKSYELSVSTRDYLLKTKNIWQNHKDAQKLEGYLKKINLKKTVGKDLLLISSDFVGLKVRSIKKIKTKDKFVYDFSVLGDQNFIAGNGGVLVHNSDGNHIRTLVLTLLYRYFRPLIENGFVYIAQPPLYKIQAGKEIYYAYNDSEKDKIIKEIQAKKKKEVNIDVQRYKGLGEMNPEELWATTLNPEKRILKKVTLEDAEEADRLFTILMGQEVEPRKRFIETYAHQVQNLDI